MGAHPFTHGIVDASLPTLAGGSEGGQHIGIKANGDALLHYLSNGPAAWLEHGARGRIAKQLGQHLSGWAGTGKIRIRPFGVVIVN